MPTFRLHVRFQLAAAFAAMLAPAAVAAESDLKIQNAHLSLQFAPEGSGMGLVALEHRGGGGAPETFIRAVPEAALIWRLILKGPGGQGEEVRLDNRAPCRRSARIDAGTALLSWEGIDLPGEPGALDVRVEVKVPAESIWRISVKNRSAKLGAWEVHFPAFQGFGAKGDMDVAIPRGNWGVLQKKCAAPAGGYYPSNDWPMQFLLAGKGDRGLLLCARDPEAWPKRFHLDPGGEVTFNIYAADMGKPGAGFEAPLEVAIEAYRGPWWVGAKSYRSWALKAPWARRGPIAGRKDFPSALRRTALWWLGGGGPGETVPRMKEAAARFDVPLAVHWYNWHQIPFDVNYPEYFPTKDGFAAGVKELVSLGQTVMPYINGRLWDVAGPNFPGAKPAACKQPGGTEVYIETYGSGAKLAPMCPLTPLWRARVGEIVRRLNEECGVNAVYIDQIGSAGPVLCHDPTHGHTLGGGNHWVGGYREMLKPISDFAVGRGLVLTTENNAEPYMDTIDAFLIWLPRTDDEIPLITAVYSGHAVYFSSPSREGMDPDAFAMLQGRDLLWGCQLGWMGFDLLDAQKKEQAEYLLKCARYRRALEKFFVDGELVGELQLLEAPPVMDARWGGWQGTHPAKLPSVMTAVWRAPDGHLALLAANLSREPRNVSYAFDGRAWATGRKFHLERIRPEGREDLGDADATVRRSETLAPRDFSAIEMSPR